MGVLLGGMVRERTASGRNMWSSGCKRTFTIGALTFTSTLLGVPYYIYSTMGPKSLF